MTEAYLLLSAIGAAAVVLALFARPIEQSVLTAPLLMVALGVLLGPLVLGVTDPTRWGNPLRILEEGARVTLAIALMGIALRLPAGYLQRHWRSLALLLGAVLAPTDPVVASSIVTGSVAERHLPTYYRRTLSAESGANDGLAYPLVMLPILLLLHPPATAATDWLLHALLREVGGALVLGIALGILAGRLLRWAEARGNMEKSSFLAYTLALSLLALGLARVIQAEPLVTVFVTGVAFDHLVGGRERAQEENIQEAMNQLFILPVFGLFGLLLPWQAWLAIGWPAFALALALLALRRLPAVLILGRGMPVLERTTRDSLYLGWFGPIGVAALLYATAAVRHTGEELIWSITSLVVLVSLFAHGMSAAPLARRYRR